MYFPDPPAPIAEVAISQSDTSAACSGRQALKRMPAPTDGPNQPPCVPRGLLPIAISLLDVRVGEIVVSNATDLIVTLAAGGGSGGGGQPAAAPAQATAAAEAAAAAAAMAALHPSKPPKDVVRLLQLLPLH